MVRPAPLPAERAPELDLLLACARWPQNETDREQIRVSFAGLAQPQLERFLKVALHHRLVPLVSRNLRASIAGLALTADQQAIVDQFGQLAAANAYRALRSLAEMGRLLQELEAAGISVKVLKGIPLAQSVFGDLSLRATGDLDLLIPEDSILKSDQILRAAGYRGLFQVQRFTPKRLAFYRTHWKDIAYENSALGHQVDLHWRCFRNSEMPGGDLCAAKGETSVDFGNVQVNTLPRMETLLYLCVHGTLDGWLYLKSLADVGASVRTMPEQELNALAVLATHYGILPELSAGLLLANRYFGMEHWSARLLDEGDPTVGHILSFARESLEGGGFLADREEISARSMMSFELGLRRNFRYRMELLLRVLFRARMWETIPLPDFLFGMYPLLSPFEWIVFRVRQWLDKPPSGVRFSV
ncbi:MAG: hypothetical protein NVSMB62_08720 [Acidobacteriaceae bacterium]